MNIHRVVQQAIDDPNFAKKLRETATKIKAGVTGSPEWEALLKQFGTDSRQLKQLQSAARCGSGSSALVPLIKALQAADAPERDEVLKKFGTNSAQVQLAAKCGSGSSDMAAVKPIIEALQVMNFHTKPK